MPQSWIKAYTEDGRSIDRPDATQVQDLVASLGPENGFLILERQDGPTGFAQTAIPRGEGEPWVVEYREGADHYQAFTDQLEDVADALVEYSRGAEEFVSRFDWQLLMRHSD